MKASMSTCRLEQIYKFHSSLSELINNLELPPPPIRYSKKLSEEAIRLLLELSPVQVVRSGKEKYACIAGIKQLLLARAKLPLEYEIPVLLHHGRRVDKTEVKKRLLVELYHQPSLMSVAYGDTQTIGSISKSLKTLNPLLLAELNLETDDLQAYWSGVSKGTIGRGRK